MIPVCHDFPKNAEDMTIFFKTIQLAVPVILLVAPFFFYKRKSARALGFYVSMAIEPQRRRTYLLMLAISVLLFNYTFFSLDGASLWLLPGVILGFALLRNRFTDAMLHWLGEDRVIQGIAFGGVLLSLVVPELYSLSASMAMVFTAAMFYPSREIIHYAEFPRSYLEIHLSNDDIVDLYYSTCRAGSKRHCTTHECREGHGKTNNSNDSQNEKNQTDQTGT